jgi:hypothetical protein
MCDEECATKNVAAGSRDKLAPNWQSPHNHPSLSSPDGGYQTLLNLIHAAEEAGVAKDVSSEWESLPSKYTVQSSELTLDAQPLSHIKDTKTD